MFDSPAHLSEDPWAHRRGILLARGALGVAAQYAEYFIGWTIEHSPMTAQFTLFIGCIQRGYGKRWMT